jgi:predicted MFS family arabinose efflux permease
MDSSSRTSPPSRRLGVWLILLCFALSVASRGLSDSFSVYVLPWQSEFGADRAAITGVYSVVGLGIGFGGLLTGWMVDKLGLRTTTLVGALAAGLGAVLASQATALWQVYLTFGALVGLAGASLGGVLHAAMLGRWYSARLGTAIAIAYSGNGIGYLMMTPVAQVLIDARDWRFALLAIGIALLALLIPALMLLPWKTISDGDPALASRRVAVVAAAQGEAKMPTGPTLLQAMREAPFWGLFFAFAMTSVGIYTLTPQVVALLIERGFDSRTAASAWGLTGLLLPLGMIGFNWLGDRGGRFVGAGLAYACTLIGLAGLWLVRGPGDLLALGAFVIFFDGLAWADDLDALDAALSRRASRPHLRRDHLRHGTGRGGRRLARRVCPRRDGRLRGGDGDLRVQPVVRRRAAAV